MTLIEPKGLPKLAIPSSRALATMPVTQDAVRDRYSFLPTGAVAFDGYFEGVLENSLTHWNKGVVPYAAFVEMFRSGRRVFAQGEMWGKAVRAGAMFYRYRQDPQLKQMLAETVADLLSTKRANGSISCVGVGSQPDGPGGDVWERKYVLLGLEEYYTQVEPDRAVLQAMIDEADTTLRQIGLAPKIAITDLGWSPNHIESSTIPEPILRLYRLTGYARYLEFARYIVEQGGVKGNNVIEQAFQNMDPEQMAAPYPKAYEMMSFFEGVAEYYRTTGDERCKTALLNFFHKVIEKEITLIGNGGGDQPYQPKWFGEAWDYTAIEQTNPEMDRSMETCSGVTWLKLCSQIFRLTGNPLAMDQIERYAYNGLIGAMKPEGDGFSYVNKLNGVKTNPSGWGGTFQNVSVTCCNLNGPMGLAYLPLVAVMSSQRGPVINLYQQGSAKFTTPGGQDAQLILRTDYPRLGTVRVQVLLHKPERFAIHLRIPAWSAASKLIAHGQRIAARAGTYAAVERMWSAGESIRLELDMRCRVIPAPHGSNRRGDRFVALVRGPIVLARDENIDANYDEPVSILSGRGYVTLESMQPALTGTQMQFRVPTANGRSIEVVDYASVNNWNGKHICTWLPMA